MRTTAILVLGASVWLSGCASHSRPLPTATTAAVTVGTSATVTATVTLSAEQAAFVRSYYDDGGRGRGKGRGNGGLPPGIAKNLERGKPLPPGLAKQGLPSDVLVRLPRPPTGLEYVVAAGKLLLVEAATQVVRDILLDVAFG